MALSDEDSRRFGRLGTEYARNIVQPEGVTDETLATAMEIQYASELGDLSPAERTEALAVMVRVCRRRIEAMNRVTIADARRKP